MIFKTTGGRIEVGYERGSVFFVRLPLLGEVLWTDMEGWQYWTWRYVKAQQARLDQKWAARRTLTA
jgi:hypothetical protein